MVKRVTSFNIVQTGKLLAMFYGLIAMVFLPFMLIAALSGEASAVLPMIFMLVMYPIMGFIGGMLMAVVYNFSAHWVGGLEVTVESFGLD